MNTSSTKVSSFQLTRLRAYGHTDTLAVCAFFFHLVAVQDEGMRCHFGLSP